MAQPRPSILHMFDPLTFPSTPRRDRDKERERERERLGTGTPDPDATPKASDSNTNTGSGSASGPLTMTAFFQRIYSKSKVNKVLTPKASRDQLGEKKASLDSVERKSEGTIPKTGSMDSHRENETSPRSSVGGVATKGMPVDTPPTLPVIQGGSLSSLMGIQAPDSTNPAIHIQITSADSGSPSYSNAPQITLSPSSDATPSLESSPTIRLQLQTQPPFSFSGFDLGEQSPSPCSSQEGPYKTGPTGTRLNPRKSSLDLKESLQIHHGHLGETSFDLLKGEMSFLGRMDDSFMDERSAILSAGSHSPNPNPNGHGADTKGGDSGSGHSSSEKADMESLSTNEGTVDSVSVMGSPLSLVPSTSTTATEPMTPPGLDLPASIKGKGSASGHGHAVRATERTPETKRQAPTPLKKSASMPLKNPVLPSQTQHRRIASITTKTSPVVSSTTATAPKRPGLQNVKRPPPGAKMAPVAAPGTSNLKAKAPQVQRSFSSSAIPASASSSSGQDPGGKNKASAPPRVSRTLPSKSVPPSSAAARNVIGRPGTGAPLSRRPLTATKSSDSHDTVTGRTTAPPRPASQAASAPPKQPKPSTGATLKPTAGGSNFGSLRSAATTTTKRPATATATTSSTTATTAKLPSSSSQPTLSRCNTAPRLGLGVPAEHVRKRTISTMARPKPPGVGGMGMAPPRSSSSIGTNRPAAAASRLRAPFGGGAGTVKARETGTTVAKQATAPAVGGRR